MARPLSRIEQGGHPRVHGVRMEAGQAVMLGDRAKRLALFGIKNAGAGGHGQGACTTKSWAAFDGDTGELRFTRHEAVKTDQARIVGGHLGLA